MSPFLATTCTHGHIIRPSFPLFFPPTDDVYPVTDVPAVGNPMSNDKTGYLHLGYKCPCQFFH